MEEVWGYLWLYDGREIDLRGQSIHQAKKQIMGVGIKSYGQKEIGDEANVCIKYPDGTEKTVTGIKNVREIFS